MKCVAFLCITSLYCTSCVVANDIISPPRNLEILHQDPFSRTFSARLNSAIFSSNADPSIHATFAKPYLSSHIINASVFSAFPFRSAQFGIDISYYGYRLLSLKEISLSYGGFVSNKLILASTLSFNHIKVRKSTSLGFLKSRLAFFYKQSDRLRWTAILQFPFRKNISESNIFPLIINLGIKYQITELIETSCELIKELYEKLYLRQLISYAPFNYVSIRFAYSVNPLVFSGGICLLFNKISLYVDLKNQQYFGTSPSMSISAFL